MNLIQEAGWVRTAYLLTLLTLFLAFRAYPGSDCPRHSGSERKTPQRTGDVRRFLVHANSEKEEKYGYNAEGADDPIWHRKLYL